MTCAECGGTEFERESNILDVWFDSGSSHEAVLPFREDHHWPADIYLEGSDQHRGWFHSSLLVGIGTRGRAPFNQVLTHGFVMDEQGRKMSKSLGNTTAPQDVIKQSGSEILRLWVVDGGLPLRHQPRQGGAGADGRELSQVPQRDPRAGRQPVRLRSEGRCRAEGEDAGDRSLGAGEVRRRGREDRQGLRGLRLSGDLPDREPVDHRRPERVLRRRDEGPHVHLRRASPKRAAPARPRCSPSSTASPACSRRCCR